MICIGRLIDELKARGGEKVNGSGKNGSGPKVVCSLVKSIGPIPIPGVKSFGNVLEIPGFGIVSLAELRVGEKIYEPSDRPSNYFDVTMLRLEMGCIGDGTASAANAATNGHHQP